MQSSSAPPRLVLASASPRRRALLQTVNVPFLVVPSEIDETPAQNEAPDLYVARMATNKATAVISRCPGLWILGADTIVTLDDSIFGKPENSVGALKMLTTLSGRTHDVMTAVSLIDRFGNLAMGFTVTSHVTFRALSPSEVSSYVATDEPLDKAGAYAVQGKGRALIEEVNGSLTNVIGLPMDEVGRALQNCGLIEETE